MRIPTPKPPLVARMLASPVLSLVMWIDLVMKTWP